MKKPLAVLLAFGLSLIAVPAAAFKCMPLYGNWCGAGYPPAGTFPPPVDEFDAACMRHDLCTSGSGPLGDNRCDYAFVQELHALAAKYHYLPRPLQWAEYALRVKTGGPWGGMPTPTPGDMAGFLGSAFAPCW